MITTKTILALCSAALVRGGWVIDPAFDITGLPAGFNWTSLTAVCLDEANHEVYVAQHGSPGVVVLSDTGEYKRNFGKGVLDTPHGLRTRIVDGKVQVWVADFGHTNGHGNVVRQFQGDGTLVSTLGTPGSNGSGIAPFQFDNVADITFAANGDMIVCDGDGGVNNRVSRWSKEEKLISVWGSEGTGKGQFHIPHNVFVDACQRVWVADRMNNRTQLFETDGTYLAEWDFAADLVLPNSDSTLGGVVQLQPYGLFLKNNILYVAANSADAAHTVGTVLIFDLSELGAMDCANRAKIGTPKAKEQIMTDAGGNAHWVYVDGGGKVYVAEVGASKLHRFMRQ